MYIPLADLSSVADDVSDAIIVKEYVAVSASTVFDSEAVSSVLKESRLIVRRKRDLELLSVSVGESVWDDELDLRSTVFEDRRDGDFVEECPSCDSVAEAVALWR